jgi:PAS domain S-box-containing protein
MKCVIAFGLAVLTVLVADLTPFDEPLIIYVLPIAIAAYLGGLAPGLTATAAMAMGASFLLMPPRMSLWIDNPMDVAEVAALIVTGTVLSVLCESLRRSDRAQAATLLRAVQSERRFSESFHASPIPLALTSLTTHRFAEVNHAYEKLDGYTRAELIGRTGGELGLYDQNTRDKLVRRLRRSGVIRDQALTLVRKDGVPRDLRLAMDRIVIDGAPFSLTTAIDETERKRTEAELRKVDGWLHEIASSIDELFWLETADHELLYTSPGLAKILGRGVERLDDWLELAHPADRQQLAHLLASSDVMQAEFRILRDGKVRWIHARRFCSRAADGEVARLVGVAADVTDRRTLEDQLRQSQKLDSLGMLAGGVAHDFNNILAVVSSCTGLLAESVPDEGENSELVHDIQHAVTRAVALTHQLLAFSRKQVLEPVVLDLNAHVKETRKMLKRLVGEDIVVTLSLDPDLGNVKVDPGYLTQVLMNLAVNARDAMPRGGKLALATRNIEIGPLGRSVLVSVTDTGTGMTAEVKERIFEPFFTTKERGKGTGMGLSVVHGIVDQAGGKIELDSEPGKGTTFRIYLPVVDATTTADREPQPVTERGTETVLLVDDDEFLRRSAARALRSRGYHVLEAGDGAAALETLRANPVDLLLTDVVMPGVDGRQLVEAATRNFPQLRTLYMSGYADDDVVRHGVQIGEVDLIEKPFQVQGLAAKVRQVLDAIRTARFA